MKKPLIYGETKFVSSRRIALKAEPIGIIQRADRILLSLEEPWKQV
jgi:hypothetical protein